MVWRFTFANSTLTYPPPSSPSNPDPVDLGSIRGPDGHCYQHSIQRQKVCAGLTRHSTKARMACLFDDGKKALHREARMMR